jgi:cytochrome c oxidase subunit I+III
VPFDWQVHDTHFIVAHLHYVLIGGAVFPVFAGLYYWTPMMSRRALSEKLGKWVFWPMFAGMQVTFLPMHLTGFMGMPRRVYTYLPGMGLEPTNLISTVGAFMIGAGVTLFVFDLARNFRFAAEANAGNVYGGGTLEWLPTGLYSTRSIPVVRSREPLWDQPDLARDVENGRYLLPGTATGLRETIITSPLRAEPQYLQIMPGPSVWPLLGALFTAGYFLLLTIQAYTPAVISGVLAVPSIMRWLWETDRPVAEAEVDVGGGIRLPTYSTGSGTHGWWATVMLLVVVAMIFLMSVFSFLFVYGIHPEYWRDYGNQAWALPIVALYAGAAGLTLLGRFLLRREASTHWSPATQVILAGAAIALAWWLDFTGWRNAGLDPELSAQAALIMAFVAQQGMLAAVAILMVFYLALRTSRDMIVRPRSVTFDVITLFLLYVCAQGAASATLARLFPGGL